MAKKDMGGIGGCFARAGMLQARRKKAMNRNGAAGARHRNPYSFRVRWGSCTSPVKKLRAWLFQTDVEPIQSFPLSQISLLCIALEAALEAND